MSKHNYAALETTAVLASSIARQIAMEKSEFVNAFERVQDGFYAYTNSFAAIAVALDEYEGSRSVNPEDSWDGWEYIDYPTVIDDLMSAWAEKPQRTHEEWLAVVREIIENLEAHAEADAKILLRRNNQ